MLMSHTQFALDEEALLAATAQVLDALPDIGSNFTPEERKDWIKKYSSMVSMAINKRRGYILERCGISIKEWRDKIEPSPTKTDNFPSPKDVLRCAKRNVDLRLPKDYDPKKHGDLIDASPDGQLFLWYWDSLLAKCLGRNAWGERIRHYHTISEAVHHHYSKYKHRICVVVPSILTPM